MGEKRTRQRTGYSIEKASELLGLSKEALRKRVQRKTIEAEKNKRGEWIVYLDFDNVQDVQDKRDDLSSAMASQETLWINKLLTEKDENIAHLKQELDSKQNTIDNLQKQNENMQILMLGLQQQNQLLLEGSTENGSKEKRKLFSWFK